ncbi:unnamed protein product, partial [Iphiclides podalirius]
MRAVRACADIPARGGGALGGGRGGGARGGAGGARHAGHAARRVARPLRPPPARAGAAARRRGAAALGRPAAAPLALPTARAHRRALGTAATTATTATLASRASYLFGTHWQAVAKKPAVEALTEAMWLSVQHLHAAEPSFAGLPDDCLVRIPITLGDLALDIHVDKSDARAPKVDWDARLSPFEKLMLIKSLMEEKLVFAITQYVALSLGPAFIESPPVHLPVL